MITNDVDPAYILQVQLLDDGQLRVEDADDEGGGGGAHLYHVWGQQWDVDMLPLKWVQQRH